MTLEQAREDIHLSGDIRNLGEAAARIAINDGLGIYKDSKKYSKDISDDIYYPRTKRERSAFNRSMANKTSGLKDGETKRIIINTANNFYVVEADGYMSGNIEIALPIDKNIDRIKEITEEIRNADSQGENSDSWTENLRNARRGDSSSDAGYEYGEKEKRPYGLDGEKSKSNLVRTVRSDGNDYSKGKVSVAPGIRIKSTDSAILKRIARSGNVAVVIERFNGAESASKGYYDGVLHLNAEKLSEGGFTYTGIHESVHHVARVNPEGYKSIEKFIESYYKEKGVDIKAEIKATQEFYGRRGVKLTPEEAMEEIVCNTLSDIATDADALTAFMGLDGKTQNKFIEALKALAKKLKEWASKFLKGTEYHSVVINDADTLLSLAKQLRAELTKAGQKNNTATLSNDVKYHAKPSRNNPAYLDARTVTEEDVEALINGAIEGKYNDKDYVPIRISTPGIIQERLFVDDLPMVMPVNKIKQAVKADDGVQKGNNRRGHGFSVLDIINIIKKLDEPDFLFSQPANNRGVAVVDYSSDSDSTVIIAEFDCNINPAYLSGYEGGTYNLAISSFDVDGGIVGLYEYANKNNWIEVFNKEKEGNPAKKFPAIKPFAIEQGSLKHSISNNSEDVNSKSFASFDEEYLTAVESGDTDTAQRLVDEAAEAAMKDSKIRDKGGKLQKVYHGTEAEDFYEFDKTRRGQTDSSMYGRGYYFAFDPDYSSDFGDNIREFYLDIKNPFYIDINAPAKVIADFLISKGVEVDFDYRNMICHFFAKNFGSQKFADTLVGLGYDGVIVRTDEGDYWETVAFHRNQMKLADAVTYDDDGNVIPISERFDFEKKDIRYSFGDEDINTDYSDLSKLDDKSRKVYNDRGWANGLFTDEDLVLLNQRIGEILHKNSRYVRTTLVDGTVVLDLNNKLLLLGGDLENPIINCVLAINAINDGDAEFIREDIKYELQCSKFNKESFAAFLKASQLIYGEESVRMFDRDDYQYIKGRVDAGDRASLPDNWQNYGYTKSKRNGAGVSSKAQRGVPGAVSKVDDKSYSFGEEDLDLGLYLSDGTEVAENLKDSNAAVGHVFELTRDAVRILLVHQITF